MKSLPILDRQQGPGASLDMAQASASPCASCATSPCCTHLPLHTFTVDSFAALDHARYLLGFRHIELGLSADGAWSVYYHYPCRYLDRETFGCTVHDSILQPRICVHYNPYTCWYKRVLTPTVSEDFLRIDERRMAYVLEHVEFDDNRRLVGVPDWDAMVKAMAEMEVAPLDGAPVDGDAVFDRWLELAASGASESEAPAQRSYGELGDPCTGCSAYCCKALVFPGVTPTNVSGFDYLRFALGFPGIEVGVSDRGWSLIVKTTCRHLENDRCTLYGKPERPLLCRYYDAQRCTYKPQFGLARPQDFVRVRLEQWHWLVEAFAFDEHGAITQGASSGDIRQHIEAGWRAQVQGVVAAHTEAAATPTADEPGNP